MEFGFDEFGRPVAGGRRTEQHRDARSNDDEDDDAHRRVAPVNPLDEDSDAFSDDVEIVDGEDATEDITKATVHSTSGRQDTATSRLLLEDRRVAKDHPVTNFVALVSSIPQRLRTVAAVGALHHGKTSLLSMIGSSNATTVPYTQRKDETARGITVKTNITSVMLAGSALGATSTSLVTLVDTPGHPSLASEMAAGLRLADSVLLCVDAVEGVLDHTETIIRQCALEDVPIALVITKIDRLVLDLRLPPLASYRKMRGIIDTVNNHIASVGSTAFVSPTLGSVLFASSKLQLCFTLETFAVKYLATSRAQIAPSALAKKLWGNVTYDTKKKAFISCEGAGGIGQPPVSFVTFVLDPIYKVVAHASTGTGHQTLSTALSRTPAGPLAAMREAVRFYFGDAHASAASAVLNITANSITRAARLLERSCGHRVRGCVALSPLKRIQSDTRSYHVVKVLTGVLRASGTCAIMEEGQGSDEPYFATQYESLFLKTPEGLVEVPEAKVGQVVLALPQAPDRSMKAYVLFQSEDGVFEEQRSDCLDALNELIVVPLLHDTPRVLVSVEPVEPQHVAALRLGMQKVARTSPGLDVRAEDTGEFTICGFGEVHLDVVFNELRSIYCPDIPIKLSSPFVSFAETVRDGRGVLALVGKGGPDAPNTHRVGITSGALAPDLASLFEGDARWDLDAPRGSVERSTIVASLRREHKWDILDANRVMAAGPNPQGPNVLINDVVDEDDLLTATIDHPLPLHVSRSVVQGFRNALRSGPLCGEPVRHVVSRLTCLSVPERGNSDVQTALLARQAVTQSLFGARLQLLEPVCAVEVVTTPWRIDAIRDILQMRRGAVLTEAPVPATPLTIVKASLPLMDSFGFETQLRMSTVGEAFCTLAFDHWGTVPGDPLDESVRLEQLEPARGFQLARDFVLKTRYRKGLTGSIVVPQ